MSNNIYRKGIILAGGKGTRLDPLTSAISKQILPVYDKPMIYYALSVLMLASIKEILIISSPEHLPLYKQLLGDGSRWGIFICYEEQRNPNGIGESFIIGKDFIADNKVALILGDNIFYGTDFEKLLFKANALKVGAMLFGCEVDNACEYGVVDFDDKGKINHIEEKPLNPKSKFAVTGLYFYDERVVEIARFIKPSKRNELEITDINNIYLNNEELELITLDSSFSWMDTGNCDNLLTASNLVYAVQKKEGRIICCLEEIALLKKWISFDLLEKNIHNLPPSNYNLYLKKLLNESH